MKKNLTLIAALFAFACSTKSQNLIVGSTMDNPVDWAYGACDVTGVSPEIAFADETAYGGTNSGNNIAEIDILTCIRQDVNIIPGTIYTINFKGTRRIGCVPIPASPGITVTVTGVTSNTVYSSVDYTYSNTTWTGFTNEIQIWSIPIIATDAAVRILVTPFNNPNDCGVVLDDFTMVASGTLPVNLSLFNAAPKNAGVELNWTTSSESNSAYFSVQHSKDGVNFFEIGKVTAANLSSGSSYTFIDAAAANGLNYYRLKQIDKNGIFKISGIVKLNLAATDVNAMVYPTVVNSVLNYAIETPKAVKLSVLVTDVTGKIITAVTPQTFTAGTTQKTINVSALASGVYMLTVSDGDGSFKKSIKFSKN